MTPDELSSAIRAAVARAVDSGAFTAEVPDEIVLERPKNREHGDYASNVALRLARSAGRPPRPSPWRWTSPSTAGRAR